MGQCHYLLQVGCEALQHAGLQTTGKTNRKPEDMSATQG